MQVLKQNRNDKVEVKWLTLHRAFVGVVSSLLFLQLSTAIPGYPWPANCLINLNLLRLLSLTKRVVRSVASV